MTLPDLLEWYMDHLDPIPTRLHVRGVWADEAGGSHLGTPAWDPQFARWLQAAPRATMVVEIEQSCFHLGGRPCRSCSVLQTDGSLWETGVARSTRLRYRWPMRRVLDRLSKIPVRDGRPPLHHALTAIQAFDGQLGLAGSAMADRYPLMSNPRFATGYFYYALRRAYRSFDEEPEPLQRHPVSHRSRQRSDSQLDAEAAGRVHSPEQELVDATARPAAGA